MMNYDWRKIDERYIQEWGLKIKMYICRYSIYDVCKNEDKGLIQKGVKTEDSCIYFTMRQSLSELGNASQNRLL